MCVVNGNSVMSKVTSHHITSDDYTEQKTDFGTNNQLLLLVYFFNHQVGPIVTHLECNACCVWSDTFGTIHKPSDPHYFTIHLLEILLFSSK